MNRNKQRKEYLTKKFRHSTNEFDEFGKFMPLYSDELKAEREEAASVAADMAKERAASRAEEILRDDTGPFEKVKDLVRMAKKRMRTVQQYVCDHCDTVIQRPSEGFVIHGNIYTANPMSCEGLVGNNFPKEGTVDQVQKTVVCKPCLLKMLNIGKSVENPGAKSGATSRLAESYYTTSDFEF